MAGFIAKFSMATFAAVLLSQSVLVSQPKERSIGTCSVGESKDIFAFAVSMAIFVFTISMVTSTAVQVFRALYNYFTDTGDTSPSTIKILSYNVLFKNNIELQKRMEALGDLILFHFPDVICFQEVTPEIYGIFEQSSWWNSYHCSVLYDMIKTRQFFCIQLSKLPVNSISFVPFRNSGTPKKISMVEIEVYQGKPLVIATSHLKSHTGNLKGPIPADDKFFSKERVAQAKSALNLLKKYPNVIFGGDMNWDEEVDGRFPLLDGWVDAWTEMRQRESGWTYDTKSNPMLAQSHINRPLQKRPDRFVCNLKDFKLKEIDLIGRAAIQGLPNVLPSDHYGLLLEVQAK